MKLENRVGETMDKANKAKKDVSNIRDLLREKVVELETLYGDIDEMIGDLNDLQSDVDQAKEEVESAADTLSNLV